jgi:hypothetical protein
MMSKILAAFIFIPTLVLSSISEEAIVLNQELQFLEESATRPKIKEFEGSAQAMDNKNRKRRVIEESLEKTYFGEDLEDNVSTRTSGPKRRRSF